MDKPKKILYIFRLKCILYATVFYFFFVSLVFVSEENLSGIQLRLIIMLLSIVAFVYTIIVYNNLFKLNELLRMFDYQTLKSLEDVVKYFDKVNLKFKRINIFLFSFIDRKLFKQLLNIFVIKRKEFIVKKFKNFHYQTGTLINNTCKDLDSLFLRHRQIHNLIKEFKILYDYYKKYHTLIPEEEKVLLDDVNKLNGILSQLQCELDAVLKIQYSIICDDVKKREKPGILISKINTMLIAIERYSQFFDKRNTISSLVINRKLQQIINFCNEKNNCFYNNSNDVDNLNGQEFERYCANLLIAYGFKNIEVTKGSGDQGVDIIGYYNGYKYAIQCKRYSKKLGNSPVQEVVAGKNFYNCQNAMVITNNYFTDAAIQLAKANNVELWDRNNLMQVIYYTDSQWDELLEKIKL